MRFLEVGQARGAASCQAEISVAQSTLGSWLPRGGEDGRSLLGSEVVAISLLCSSTPKWGAEIGRILSLWPSFSFMLKWHNGPVDG